MSYLSGFDTKWKVFLRNLTLPLRDDITRGINHLDLSKYKEKLVTKTQKFVVLKSNENKLRVVICCLLPNLSIRLVITDNAETKVNADDEYADKVVEYLNIQFQSCWKVISRLIDKSTIDKIFVRKFENCTARLLLSGYDSMPSESFHKVPMEKHLKAMKKCNFDLHDYEQLRKEFLSVKFSCFASQTKDWKCLCSCR